MKKIVGFVLSAFVLSSICSAQNIKTLDKSKLPQRPGEMMIKNNNAAEKLKKELEEKHMTIEEYEDYVYDKTRKLFEEKYPQFANTCTDVEDLIKKELFKNSNWKIKEIKYHGSDPMFNNQHSYTVVSTSGAFEAICYGHSVERLDNAIYMWQNSKDFEKCQILYNNVRKPLAKSITTYVKGYTGSNKNSIDREFTTLFYSRKKVCSYTLSYCEPAKEYKKVFLGKDKPLYPFHKCDKGEYFPIKNVVVKMEEGNDAKAYSFINLYACYSQTSPKTIYYAEDPKTATYETIVKEVPMQFKKLKEYKVNDYLSQYNIKCEDLKDEVFACATRMGHLPLNR